MAVITAVSTTGTKSACSARTAMSAPKLSASHMPAPLAPNMTLDMSTARRMPVRESSSPTNSGESVSESMNTPTSQPMLVRLTPKARLMVLYMGCGAYSMPKQQAVTIISPR